MSLQRLAGASFALALSFAPAAPAASWARDWNAVGKMRSYSDLSIDPRVFAGPGGTLLYDNGDGRVIAYGADGQYRWSAAAGGSAGHEILPAANLLIADAVIDADASAWILESGDGTIPMPAVLTRIGSDGRVLWSRQLPGSALARAQDGVVVAGPGKSRMPFLTRWSEDGHLLWQRPLGTAPVPTGGAAPVVAELGGDIYTLKFYPEANGRWRVMRFDAQGTALKTLEFISNGSGGSGLHGTPSTLYAVVGGKVQALDPATLVPRWSASCEGVDLVPPGASGAGDLLCLDSYRMKRLAELDGQERWSKATTSGTGGFSLTTSGILRMVSTGFVYEDIATGAELWNKNRTSSGEAPLGLGKVVSGFATAAYSKQEVGVPVRMNFYRVDLADGAETPIAAVEDAPLQSVGESVLEGADLFSVLAVTDADPATLRVRREAAADGALQWESSYTPGPRDYPLTAQIVVADDYVAVAILSSQDRKISYNAAVRVVAFDRATGVQRWTKAFSEPFHALNDRPTLLVDAQGQLVLASQYNTGDGGHLLRRLAAADGELLWSRTLGTSFNAVYLGPSPNIHRLGDDILLGAGNAVRRLSVADGHDVWSVYSDSAAVSPLLVLPNNDVVLRKSDSPGAILCVEYTTGNVRWSHPLPGSQYNLDRLAFDGDGHVVSMGSRIDVVDGDFVYKPVADRLDATTGASIGWFEPDIGTQIGGKFLMSKASSDHRWWIVESREIAGAPGIGTRWLSEFDALGEVVGRQALALSVHGDLVRGDAPLPLGAPEADRLFVAGAAYGGNRGAGLRTSLLDTAVTAHGNLSVSVDPLPVFLGGTVDYGATVSYQGDAQVMATLVLLLPWSDAGASPVCVAPSGDCTLDTHSGWLTARMRLSPGDAVRVTGTLAAGNLAGAYGGSGAIAASTYVAVVTGDTALRETVIDDNHVGVKAPAGIFADGFD